MALDLTLGIVAALSASYTIHADVADQHRRFRIAKPVTTLLILCIALLDADPPTPAYRTLFSLGMAASLVGDVLLSLGARRFAAGLVAFLVAHLLYIAAMRSTGTPLAHWASALPFLAYALAFYTYLRAHVGRLRAAVLVYALVLSAMAWVAFSLASCARTEGRRLALLGALLFVASDSLLAYNRFRHPIRRLNAIVLGTYYAAQMLLALSV